ncbi:hypothetical protein Dda_3880 [Drechslerella dactyloides]|uniref:Uncharacterized protein n=1 Tax=Drechslerella dactyloides TaxID=74499 RepID=A0AAD6IZK9_DREDA|nr:hypothetical protein Dda_3880 [Drechslerella dactyloides]
MESATTHSFRHDDEENRLPLTRPGPNNNPPPPPPPNMVWRLLQLLLAVTMLVVTVGFAYLSMFTIFLFDSYGVVPWSLKRKVIVFSIVAVVAIINLVLIHVTMRLFSRSLGLTSSTPSTYLNNTWPGSPQESTRLV